ncbi:DNA polymerase III subunit delta' [Piscinibacter koreensis]|uniref:DNA polymerase III subunit delta' n=1 Tax=Piscinibacter koreensis TaxID=2742824 RepID=UPI003159013C
MTDASGAAALPWLTAPLQRILATQRAHALLLHGPRGVGEFELALLLAQGWLCEAADVPLAARPCRRCASCHLVDARSHPDLMVLLPDALRQRLGWSGGDAEEGGAEKASKAKPSKDIKVEAVRAAVGFVQTTAARGRAKVLVLHPAERMNAIAANALLKTLEEPPGLARFVLCSGDPAALLPTIRSRCQRVALAAPEPAEASAWLAARGVPEPALMLAAAGGQPQEVLAWAEFGIDAALWSRLPGAVTAGDASVLHGWPLPLAVEALHKLCHDALCVATGAAPRYFPAPALRSRGDVARLVAWSRALADLARDAEHPWNVDLAVQAAVQQGREALNPPRIAGAARRTASLNSSR